MAKNSSSPFPTMGKGGPPVKVAPVTSNLKTVKKTNQSKGSAGAYGMLDGVMAHRKQIHERLGSQLRITAKHVYEPNAESAGATGRNVKLVPSAMGNRDFSLRKRYQQGM